MHRPERLPPNPQSSDDWADDSVTIQLDPEKVVSSPPVTSIDPDKTTQVDLSGLAMFMPDGVDGIDVRREAPTRRFGCETRETRSRDLPDVEAPSGPISGVATTPKTRHAEKQARIPDTPGLPQNAEPPSRPVPHLEKTTIVRRQRPQADSVANRVLRGLAIFAWGFATATVLWLYLESRPGWRESVTSAVSTLWSTLTQDRAGLLKR